MTREQIERLAAAVHQLRADWPLGSLTTWIGNHLATRAYRDACVALVWVACEAETKTPARVLESGPWWPATLTPNVDRAPSSVPLDELCHYCQRSETDCQSIERDPDDRHLFRTNRDVALARARAEKADRERAEQQKTRDANWSPTDPPYVRPDIRAEIREAVKVGQQVVRSLEHDIAERNRKRESEVDA